MFKLFFYSFFFYGLAFYLRGEEFDSNCPSESLLSILKTNDTNTFTNLSRANCETLNPCDQEILKTCEQFKDTQKVDLDKVTTFALKSITSFNNSSFEGALNRLQKKLVTNKKCIKGTEYKKNDSKFIERVLKLSHEQNLLLDIKFNPIKMQGTAELFKKISQSPNVLNNFLKNKFNKEKFNNQEVLIEQYVNDVIDKPDHYLNLNSKYDYLANFLFSSEEKKIVEEISKSEKYSTSNEKRNAIKKMIFEDQSGDLSCDDIKKSFLKELDNNKLQMSCHQIKEKKFKGELNFDESIQYCSDYCKDSMMLGELDDFVNSSATAAGFSKKIDIETAREQSKIQSTKLPASEVIKEQVNSQENGRTISATISEDLNIISSQLDTFLDEPLSSVPDSTTLSNMATSLKKAKDELKNRKEKSGGKLSSIDQMNESKLNEAISKLNEVQVKYSDKNKAIQNLGDKIRKLSDHVTDLSDENSNLKSDNRHLRQVVKNYEQELKARDKKNQGQNVENGDSRKVEKGASSISGVKAQTLNSTPTSVFATSSSPQGQRPVGKNFEKDSSVEAVEKVVFNKSDYQEYPFKAPQSISKLI
jgi:regulator of replication initiation timing